MSSPDEPGVTIKLSEIWGIVRKLENLPEQLKQIDGRLEQGLANTDRLISDVRDELRTEVRNRDEKIAGLSARVTVLEADKTARDEVAKSTDKREARKTPWTAITAIIISAFVAASTYIKDIIN